MRKVQLTADSYRGGILTREHPWGDFQSHQDAPSSEGCSSSSILGTPVSAPPDVPELEEAVKEFEESDTPIA